MINHKQHYKNHYKFQKVINKINKAKTIQEAQNIVLDFFEKEGYGDILFALGQKTLKLYLQNKK